MIAYKPYSECPPEGIPEGMPLNYPWIQQSCTQCSYLDMTRKGWIILTEADYQALLDDLADEIAAWHEIYNTPEAP